MRREIRKLKKKQMDQELVIMEEQLYDDISIRMMDNENCYNNTIIDRGARIVDNSTLFSNSKLISEVDADAKYLTDAKKKKFMRDHL